MAANLVRASSQYIDISSLGTHANGTMCCAFKSSNSGAGAIQCPLVADNGAQTSSTFMGFGGNWTGAYADESVGYWHQNLGGVVLRFFVRNGVDFYQDGKWHRMIIRVDGADNAVFIDGVKETVTFDVGAANTANAFLNFTNNTWIGGGNFAATLFVDGQIDDMRIYSAGLTDGECIAITGGSGNDCIVHDLEGWWRMDELADGQNIATAIDISGNGINGTGTNNPTYQASPLTTISGGF